MALVDIVTSPECIAAFVGALAAFALAAVAKWAADKRSQWMAGNEAIFAVAQMYSLVVGLKRQQFDEQIERCKGLIGKEPDYTQFVPVEIGVGEVLRPRLDALGFLLQSHDPDLLNRLAVVVQQFDVTINAMHQLNRTQNQFQQAFAALLVNFPGGPTLDALESTMNPYLMARLKALVEATRDGLPNCANDLKEIGKQLSSAISYSFPTRLVAGFDAIEREGPTQVPATAGKPRLWRKAIRFIFRIGRKKVF